MSREGTGAAHENAPGVSAFRARSLSEDTVRVHPSPAPSAPGPLQLSRDTSQDSAVLREGRFRRFPVSAHGQPAPAGRQ